MPNTVRPLIAKCSLAALAFWAVAGHTAPPPTPAGAAPVSTAPSSAAPAPTVPAPGANAQPAAPLTGPQVIQLLDRTIDWYRTLGIQQQTANEPSDLLILNDN